MATFDGSIVSENNKSLTDEHCNLGGFDMQKVFLLLVSVVKYRVMALPTWSAIVKSLCVSL